MTLADSEVAESKQVGETIKGLLEKFLERPELLSCNFSAMCMQTDQRDRQPLTRNKKDS